MRYLSLLILLLPGLLLAAEPNVPKARAEEFLGGIQRGDIAGAYDRLFQGSAIPKDKPQTVTLAKQQTPSVIPLYGRILGYDLIHEEKFGPSLTRLVYLMRAEKHPVTWEFYFYKPKAEWFVANVLFNDQFTSLGPKN